MIGRMQVSAREAMGPAATRRRVFSTAGLPAGRRVGLWESHNASALIGLDVHADSALQATEINVELPGVRLARVSGSAHAVERSAAVIDRCPADSVAIYLTVRGGAWFTSAEGTRGLRPGDALVCATDQPFARGFDRGLEELVVTAPCSLLLSRYGVARPVKPSVTSFGTPCLPPGTGAYARALARLAGRVTGTGYSPPPDERTVLDLAAVLVAGRIEAPATAHRAAAHCYIEEHLTSQSLSAGQVAAAVGISERQLSRVFAAVGTSVPRHILACRLRLAYSILAAPPAERARSDETVADVAVRCGFTSASYFSHVFRQYFGLRASDIGR
jgi:AraC-like DNA-binding protein